MINENKVASLIQKLSKDTLDGKINWQRLVDYDNLDRKSNQALSMLLFQNEFRQISPMDSFYATCVGDRDIFLINETVESGRDGTITSGYKIYLYNDQNKNVTTLSCRAAYLYQLLDSINSYLSRNEAEVESFIDNYLAQN